MTKFGFAFLIAITFALVFQTHGNPFKRPTNGHRYDMDFYKDIYRDMADYLGKAKCENKNKNCAIWAKHNYCNNKQYEAFMFFECPKSCDTCGGENDEVREINNEDKESFDPQFNLAAALKEAKAKLRKVAITKGEGCVTHECLRTDCKYGLARDSKGCIQCSCRDKPITKCPVRRCEVQCPNGYKQDMGCDLCECVDNPSSKTAGKRIPAQGGETDGKRIPLGGGETDGKRIPLGGETDGKRIPLGGGETAGKRIPLGGGVDGYGGNAFFGNIGNPYQPRQNTGYTSGWIVGNPGLERRYREKALEGIVGLGFGYHNLPTDKGLPPRNLFKEGAEINAHTWKNFKQGSTLMEQNEWSPRRR